MFGHSGRVPSSRDGPVSIFKAALHVDATLVADTEQTIRTDESHLQQLIANVLHIPIDHGSEDVTITVNDLASRFYVADDGPDNPSEEGDGIVESGYSTRNEGLASVV